MMLMGDRKKMITTIVGRMKPSPDFVQKLGEPGMSPKMEQAPEVDESYGMEAAAEDVIAALKMENPKRLAAALQAFFELCEYKEDALEGK